MNTLACLLKTIVPLVLVVHARAVLAQAPITSGSPDRWGNLAEYAGQEHGDAGRRAAEFLALHRPAGDSSIDQRILQENLSYALRARREFAWAKTLTDDLFLNDVLPYAVLDETRESWRPEFYKRCRAIVADAGAKTATEAAQAINRELFNQINVHYNTGRKKPNQSPSESVEQGRATCTGLSIILVYACRSVGIPARIAGVANWADKRGNHTWVEIWDDGWHFTGADEYNDRGLNRAWFDQDASRAIPGSEEHAVWATSWRSTGKHFPMVWDRASRAVHGIDVTERYVSKRGGGPKAETTVFLRAWDTRGGKRIVAEVAGPERLGGDVPTVTTRAGTTDLNDMPSLPIADDRSTRLAVTHAGEIRYAALGADGPRTIDLFWDELGLSRDQAEREVLRVTERLIESRRGVAEQSLSEMQVRSGDHTLRLKERSFGEAPWGERSLWISMHGGGGAPSEVNDQQWQNQIELYEPAEGYYVAPRAPTDTWNLWHQAHIDALFDALIEHYVVARGVDPDRVYLMGYSAGGDGVYQLAPRMADRFAAAAMMAGHPNETKPLGLRNLPFALLMGGDDSAYDRSTIARQWERELGLLSASDPGGYRHRVIIYEGLGHWMERRDAEILPWMHQQIRSAWPSRIVWHQDDVTHDRFYWLSTEEPSPRSTVVAQVSGQRIEIHASDPRGLTIRLSDALLDLDRNIAVIVNGEDVFSGFVQRTPAAIEASLAERLDPVSAASAVLHIGPLLHGD